MRDIIAIVAAAAGSRGIGANGKLAWRLPADMIHFKQVTTTPPTAGLINAVIMGRITWDSIPSKFRPLTDRINVVLTSKSKKEVSHPHPPHGLLVASSLHDAKEQLAKMQQVGDIYIIGGEKVYQESMQWVTRVVYTEVSNVSDVRFDVWFPELKEDEWECRPFPFDESRLDGERQEKLRHSNTGLQYRFLEYRKRLSTTVLALVDYTYVNTEELQYLDMCRDIIDHGVQKSDRTNVGTRSKFGTQMRFSLRDGTLPLLTTKRTFWRGVAEELLWFVQGNTNANDLADKNIHIWDGNGSREFLDQRGLAHREVGDLGPVYGFQWRHFGAKYVDMHTDYTGQGVDQLAMCIDQIKHNPDNRRIIMSAWNPSDLNAMALPPCHMFCQFYVDTQRNELSCQMYQRSADMGLGVPFNIASYALLTHMMAHVTGRKPGDLVHTIGDAHVYLNHVTGLQEQLQRTPRPFPQLVIKKHIHTIDDFVYEDFEVVGYNPHKSIQLDMAV